MKDEFSSIETIFDNAPIGMILTTISGQVINMNNYMINMLGYSSLEDIRKNLKNMADGIYEIPELREKIITSAKNNEVNTPIYLQIKRKEGTLISVRVHILNYQKESTNEKYLISTVEDLTYQNELEFKIADVKQQFQQLYNTSPAAIFIHQDEKLIDYNDKAKELFGLYDSSRIYMFTDISPEYQPDGQKSREKGMVLIKKALDGFPQVTEWELIAADGSKVLGEIAINRIEAGFYGNLFAIFQDMTEIRNAQKRLQVREAMLSSIIDSLPFELLVTDLDSNVIIQNKFTKDIWGDYSGKNVLSAPLNEEAKKLWLKNIEQIKNNHFYDYETEVTLKGVTKHQHRISAPFIIDDKIDGGIHLSIDITRRKRLEKTLIDSEKRAKIQRTALSELMIGRIFSSGEIDLSFQKVAELISSTLSVARGSIWTISDDGSQLQCLSLFNAQSKTFNSGDVLKCADFPAYFEAINKENRVYAEDTFNDPRTKQLTDSHLKEHGITSLLDSGVFIEGKLTGVVSAEHIGAKRKWMPDEESFISTVAAVVAQLFEEQKRKEAEQELINHKNNLELLVRERTYDIEQLNEELRASNEELEIKNKELEEYARLFEGREFRIKELRDKVKELEKRIKSEDM